MFIRMEIREQGERVIKMYHVCMKLSKNKANLKDHLCSTKPLPNINLYRYTCGGRYTFTRVWRPEVNLSILDVVS